MKEKKYDYKELDVYKESKRLVKMVYMLLKKFPKEEQYALCDQLISDDDIRDVQSQIARTGALLSGVRSWRMEEKTPNR